MFLTHDSPYVIMKRSMYNNKNAGCAMNKKHDIERLMAVRAAMNAAVLERKEETDGILLSVLSGAGVFFLGDPGTAKTFHIQLASTLLGLTNFDILMSETTKPDQIFGPTDIPALAQGKQQTKYIGYAPACEILFFDEIFKANSTVLNPILWLINEGLFRDGDNGVIKCKVLSTFAASNELPTDPMLAALYDRFLLRFNVSYLKSENNTRKMVRSYLAGSEKAKSILDREAVARLRQLTEEVEIPDSVLNVAMSTRRRIEFSMGYKISDRRFAKTLRVVQASAVLAGRTIAENVDLEVMANIMWKEPQQIARVQNLVFAATSGDTVAISTYVEQANAIKDTLKVGSGLVDKYNELVELYRMVKTFKSRYAVRAAAEIKSIGMLVRHLITERKTFRVVRVVQSGVTIFKVVQASSSVWSQKELRAFGFRHKRKGMYWYYTGSIRELKASFREHQTRLEISEGA